jgi:hypothetical protein
MAGDRREHGRIVRRDYRGSVWRRFPCRLGQCWPRLFPLRAPGDVLSRELLNRSSYAGWGGFVLGG